MKIRRFFLPGMLGFALLAAGTPAAAQQASAPAKLEKLEEVDAPPVTIRGGSRGANERQITQKREQGRVTEVKVKSGNNTYYLKPNPPAGTASPGDARSDMTRPAQWKVMEFDWNNEQEKKTAQAKAATVPPPPAPPAGK